MAGGWRAVRGNRGEGAAPTGCGAHTHGLQVTFERAAKKLHPQQKTDIDTAVRNVADDPGIGEAKVGDLVGVQVFKFRMTNQFCVLSYRVLDKNTLKLLTVGTHKNVYRDLKRIDH